MDIIVNYAFGVLLCFFHPGLGPACQHYKSFTYTPYKLVDREDLMALEEPAAIISRIHPETTGSSKCCTLPNYMASHCRR